GDDVVRVAGEVGDAEITDALRLGAVAHALPQARELLRVTPRDLDHVGRIPGPVPVALAGVSLEPVRERLHFGPLARERPLALRAHALAHRRALHLGLIEVVHHLGPLALHVGPGVLVDAKPLLHALSDTLGGRAEVLADDFFVRF